MQLTSKKKKKKIDKTKSKNLLKNCRKESLPSIRSDNNSFAFFDSFFQLLLNHQVVTNSHPLILVIDSLKYKKHFFITLSILGKGNGMLLMLALESRCIPEVLGGVPMFKNDA